MNLPNKYHKWMFEFENRHRAFLATERTFWRMLDIFRHPRTNYFYWKKWQDRPAIGEYIEDCRGKTLKVVALGETEDDLTLEDGTRASWMNCCHRP